MEVSNIPKRSRPWINQFLTLSLFLGLSAQLQAQNQPSPYRIRVGTDLPLTLGSSALSLGGHLYQRRISPLTQRDLLQLDRQTVGAFDRIATRAWRPRAATLSDVGLITGALAPLAMLATSRIRQDGLGYLLLWWQALSLTDGLTNWTKALSLRTRPLAYYYADRYPDLPPDLANLALDRDARFSFSSGHTSITAVSTFFVARTFADYYPNSPARPWVWAGAVLLPAVVGFGRVRAGKHFPTDVIAGYLIGASIGWLIPRLHRG